MAVIYRLSRGLFNDRVGLASALILALAPFHIAYSQEARMYAQLGFFSAVALLAFVRYEQSRRRRWWILFVVSGTGVVYSHNLGFLILLALGLWVLARRQLSLLRGIVLAGLAIILLWSPWLVLLPSELGKISQSYWVTRPDAISLVQTLISFTVDFDNARLPGLLLPLSLFLAVLLLTLAAFQVVSHRSTNISFVAAMAFVPPALLFLVSQWRAVYITRGLMSSFLAMVVIIAWGLVQTPILVRGLVTLGGGLLILGSLGLYYQYAEFPRPPFREALTYLAANVGRDDAIVHDNKLSYFPMHYYDRARVQSFIADPSGAGSDTLAFPTQEALGLYASSLDATVQDHKRVWFVIFEEAVQEGGGNLAWLDQNYRLAQVKRFNDLDVYLFEK